VGRPAVHETGGVKPDGLRRRATRSRHRPA
jgi:hypothetical protein